MSDDDLNYLFGHMHVHNDGTTPGIRLTLFIADVLARADDKWDEVSDCHLSQAEILIAELGLRREWGALDKDEGGFLYDSRKDVRVFPGETIKSRLITDWVDDGG